VAERGMTGDFSFKSYYFRNKNPLSNKFSGFQLAAAFGVLAGKGKNLPSA
jgi:hypothetical protein